VIRHIAGIIVRPRATLAEQVVRPDWLATWVFILIAWATAGGWLLSTDIGQQALVDERVRVIESFGGLVSDEAYNALRASPPWWIYLTSGGRLLLTPAVTLAVACGVWAVARRDGSRVRFGQALAVVVHATVVLLLGQLLATPLHYVRESLTSPLNLAAVLPFMEEGTYRARFFGTLDLFGLWWAGLLAIGLTTLTGRSVGRYVGRIAIAYVGLAAAVAAVMAVMGGS
jgi:Yip1 domain